MKLAVIVLNPTVAVYWQLSFYLPLKEVGKAIKSFAFMTDVRLCALETSDNAVGILLKYIDIASGILICVIFKHAALTLSSDALRNIL